MASETATNVDVAGTTTTTTFSEIGIPGTSGESIVSGVIVTSPTQFNFAILVQVPLPFLNINLTNLIGGLIFPALSRMKIPAALLHAVLKAEEFIQKVVDDVAKLIKAIPQATVSIIVKVGDVNVINIMLVAQQTPVDIVTPTYQLALPNFAADINLAPKIPFPVPPPIVIHIPIPVPSIAFKPPITLSGGNIDIAATFSAPSQNPIIIPNTGAVTPLNPIVPRSVTGT